MTTSPSTRSRRFRDLPIERKLNVLMVGTALVVLLSALLGLAVGEALQGVRSGREDLRGLTDIIASNSIAALSFEDGDAALETLQSLEARESIVRATLYAQDGTILAHYARAESGASPPPLLPAREGVQLTGGRFIAFRTIDFHGDVIGHVFLESDLSELTSRATWWAATGGIVLLLSTALAFALSSRLERLISGPVLALAGVVRQVSTDRNYAVRARKESDDELGLLTDGLNEMLGQIQQRDAELQRAHDELEQRVADRTAELERAIGVRKEAEALLARRNAELETSNRELDAFSSSVAHDLRAPLRHIEGFGRTLTRGYADKLDDRGRGYLERMRQAAVKMGNLIDDLLHLSKMTRADLREGDVDVSALAASIVEDLRAGDPERSADVAILPGIAARGDGGLLRIALENLLGNAWKFTGKVEAKIEVGAAPTEGGELACFVRDNGAGFDMAHAENLFGIFQRLHRAEEFPGTGIGLATVRRIITRHQGRIWVQATLGEGATFWFTLPSLRIVGAPDAREEGHPGGG